MQDYGFRALNNGLQPRYAIPSQKFFTERIIPEIYNEMEEKMRKISRD